MSNLSPSRTREIMASAFPKRVDVKQQIQQRRVIHDNYYNDEDGYNTMTKNKKKWYISVIISLFAVFLLSSFSLNFIDDICAQKNIEAFDHRGDPKIILVFILFLFLLTFCRLILMLL